MNPTRRLLVILGITTAIIIGLVIVKSSPAVSNFLWNVSNDGTWLFPLVFFAAVLDSIHPCSFSILLITIAFLFGMQMTRRKIIEIGGIYIAGIFAAYFLIGLGILKVLHLFNTPHFMGKLGATLLIVFGVLNLLNYLFPRFPIKLKIPNAAHGAMGKLMSRATIPAAFILGVLVGICQFPCMGGPYLMVVGLLRDHVTYMKGFGYLVLYNMILIVPLVVVLYIAADKVLVKKVQEWKQREMSRSKLVVGIAMVIIGVLIFYI